MADRVAAHYPMLDRDLLITGVILHDIGKIRELSWEMGFDYTVEGVLLGHIQMGVDLVEKTIAGLPGFPDRLRTLVLHMILSHHGKLEFGSPKLPMIPEALVLNFVDDLDAKMQAIASEFEKSCARRPGAGRADGQGVVAGSAAIAEHESVAEEIRDREKREERRDQGSGVRGSRFSSFLLLGRQSRAGWRWSMGLLFPIPCSLLPAR